MDSTNAIQGGLWLFAPDSVHCAIAWHCTEPIGGLLYWLVHRWGLIVCAFLAHWLLRLWHVNDHHWSMLHWLLLLLNVQLLLESRKVLKYLWLRLPYLRPAILLMTLILRMTNKGLDTMYCLSNPLTKLNIWMMTCSAHWDFMTMWCCCLNNSDGPIRWHWNRERICVSF